MSLTVRTKAAGVWPVYPPSGFTWFEVDSSANDLAVVPGLEHGGFEDEGVRGADRVEAPRARPRFWARTTLEQVRVPRAHRSHRPRCSATKASSVRCG